MLMKLFFCETAAHVRQAILEEEGTVLALTSAAAAEAQARGRVYVRLEDYYDEHELLKHYGELFTVERSWSLWVDQLLQGLLPDFRRAHFEPARASSFTMLCWYAEWFVGAHVLRQVLDKLHPEVVYYWPWEPIKPPPHLQEVRSIYCSLLPIIAPQHDIRACAIDPVATAEAACMPGSAQAPGSSSLTQSVSRALLNKTLTLLDVTGLRPQLRLLHQQGLVRMLRGSLGAARSPQAVLMLGNGYDLYSLASCLLDHGVRVDWLTTTLNTTRTPGGTSAPQHLCAEQLVGLWPVVAEQPGIWAPLERWGIGRNDRAEAILRYWWHHVIPALWQGYRQAEAALAQRQYAAVVAWESGGDTLSGSMLQAAEQHKLPRLIYQHGSTARIGYWPAYVRDAETLLVYGEGTAAHLDRHRQDPRVERATIVPVGSARLDWLRQPPTRRKGAQLRRKLTRHDRRPIILYIPAAFGGYARGIGDLVGYADVSYLELLQRAMLVFAEFPQVRLLYKDFVPSFSLASPMEVFIRRSVPNGEVIRNVSLPLLCQAADAIIVDHIITALGEVLLTRKPVLAYCPEGPWPVLEPPDARALLRRRAQLAETPETFLSAIREFLHTGQFAELDAPDNSFLRAYSTHLDDGRSAERAAEAVLSAIAASVIKKPG